MPSWRAAAPKASLILPFTSGESSNCSTSTLASIDELPLVIHVHELQHHLASRPLVVLADRSTRTPCRPTARWESNLPAVSRGRSAGPSPPCPTSGRRATSGRWRRSLDLLEVDRSRNAAELHMEGDRLSLARSSLNTASLTSKTLCSNAKCVSFLSAGGFSATAAAAASLAAPPQPTPPLGCGAAPGAAGAAAGARRRAAAGGAAAVAAFTSGPVSDMIFPLSAGQRQPARRSS